MAVKLLLPLALIIAALCGAARDPRAARIAEQETALPADTVKARTRPLAELINRKEPAWAWLSKDIKLAKNKVEILMKDSLRADSALYNTQVTTRSPMGAIIYETGGMLIDHGWIRIMGSGHARLDRSLPEWNKSKGFIQDGGFALYLVADDVLGGFFAINNGGISKENTGKVFYLSPDTRQWENLNATYTEFIYFCLNGDLETFYKGQRWKTWKTDVAQLNGNQGYSCFPLLHTQEGADIEKVTRKAVPIQELWTAAVQQ